MKTLDLQKHIISGLYKGETFAYESDGKDVYISDCFRVWKLPLDVIFISLAEMKEAKVKRFLDDGDKANIKFEEVYTEGFSRYRFGEVEGIKTFYDPKLLDFFEKFEMYKLDKNPRGPIFIREEGEIVGMIMPVEGEEDG